MLPGAGKSDEVGSDLAGWVGGWFLRAYINTHTHPNLA